MQQTMETGSGNLEWKLEIEGAASIDANMCISMSMSIIMSMCISMYILHLRRVRVHEHGQIHTIRELARSSVAEEP